ncbi:hypothetical protein [Burkholderia latens]|uniref:hypothetical protein n=1 Tax=Burkholderia latens TaxID=488446 RepID=UPI000AAE0D71|nr:hypothetical protein [Burkholderia latens]
MQQNTQDTATAAKSASFCFTAAPGLMARVDQHRKIVHEDTGIKVSRSQMIASLIARGLEAVNAA